MITLGNHVIPPVAARGSRNVFICQFPFPMPADMQVEPSLLAGYDTILAYSDYAKRNIEAAITRNALPKSSVVVLYPPVPQVPEGAVTKKTIILTVGRFFTGGHSKRHDVLIEAFRTLQGQYEGPVEFHLAGSSMPDSANMDYLASLKDMAAGLPVAFHVNATPHTLEQLYRDATVYWHGTGLQNNLQKSPELAEHFGIAIVEAMSAGCVAFALNAGGAPEIITDDVDGYLYDTVDTLVTRTLKLLRDPLRQEAIGQQARERAAQFAPHEFFRAVQEVFS
jgi:glycosyltransferase involved in cell wall biosynthesis